MVVTKIYDEFSTEISDLRFKENPENQFGVKADGQRSKVRANFQPQSFPALPSLNFLADFNEFCIVLQVSYFCCERGA